MATMSAPSRSISAEARTILLSAHLEISPASPQLLSMVVIYHANMRINLKRVEDDDLRRFFMALEVLVESSGEVVYLEPLPSTTASFWRDALFRYLLGIGIWHLRHPDSHSSDSRTLKQDRQHVHEFDHLRLERLWLGPFFDIRVIKPLLSQSEPALASVKPSQLRTLEKKPETTTTNAPFAWTAFEPQARMQAARHVESRCMAIASGVGDGKVVVAIVLFGKFVPCP
jgi:hypothetical protein